MESDLRTMGVLGSDFPGVKPALSVSEGTQVSAGAVLFHDKRDPRICACAPVSGKVTDIRRGPRRTLTSISIAVEETSSTTPPVNSVSIPNNVNDLTALLLDAGLWTRLRQRPFGIIPLTEVQPQRLFVTAMDSRRDVPDLMAHINREIDAFKLGLEVFSILPVQETILCLPEPMVIESMAARALRQTTISAEHAWGISGTVIHRCSNPTPQSPVFVVDVSTVIALGQRLTGNSMNAERNVFVSGKGVARPGYYPATPGDCIEGLLEQAGSRFNSPYTRTVAGSVFDGRRIGSGNAFLGMSDYQVQVLDEQSLKKPGGLPVFDRTSFLARLGLNRFFPQTDTFIHGRAAAMVSAESIERVWPHDIPVIPLLRALLTADDETALALGALAFVEEDMSLVSWACPAKYDYGQALRAFLDRVLMELS